MTAHHLPSYSPCRSAFPAASRSCSERSLAASAGAALGARSRAPGCADRRAARRADAEPVPAAAEPAASQVSRERRHNKHVLATIMRHSLLAPCERAMFVADALHSARAFVCRLLHVQPSAAFAGSGEVAPEAAAGQASQVPASSKAVSGPSPSPEAVASVASASAPAAPEPLAAPSAEGEAAAAAAAATEPAAAEPKPAEAFSAVAAAPVAAPAVAAEASFAEAAAALAAAAVSPAAAA